MTTRLTDLPLGGSLADPFDYDVDRMRADQLELASQRLASCRVRIAALDRRAVDRGVETIKSLSDLVPLLFTDDVYKSYPRSLITKRQWPTLGRWIDSLSMNDGVAAASEGVVGDIDDWLGALRQANQFVYGSSGTSGSCSLLKMGGRDREIVAALLRAGVEWSTGVTPQRALPIFAFVPKAGHHRSVETFALFADLYGRPDATYWVSEEPLRVADVIAAAELRSSIASGDALPSAVAALEASVALREEQMGAAVTRMVDLLESHAHEPVLIAALPQQHHTVATLLRARGTVLHPDSVIWVGGGTKGGSLPPDYMEQMHNSYGVTWARFTRFYGMTELSSFLVACTAHAYHCPPWLIMLVLDVTGSELAPSVDGRLEGRAAFFDTLVEERWGGVTTGDRVTVSTRRCACGRSSPSVLAISRDLDGDDDKLTCSGTVNAYVRGSLEP